jgi:hypothetical protein
VDEPGSVPKERDHGLAQKTAHNSSAFPA